ncbi:heparan-sulfate 6-O-sulfotransferase 3-B-like [Haliotis asinina]|uniref:heparan-sulfate 6-O-sulfotransferase 3-B-like n=1 Tax=Haliotis asinina TaxID=109174 RepID=UPI003532138B
MLIRVLLLFVTIIAITVWSTYHVSFWKTSTPAFKVIYPTDDGDACNWGQSSDKFSRKDSMHSYNVSSNGSDVIVFVRIQKTGSTTFASHMAYDLDVTPWCRCDGEVKAKCACYQAWKSNVLFKRERREHPCQVHADWTHLHDCVEDAMNKRSGRKIKRRHLYVTMLRDPLPRYLSEWNHVARGATWIVPLLCNGRSPTTEELPRCFDGDWKNVTLQEFMDCQSNLAVNRQTRMLANLSIVDCYNTSASGWTYDERQYRMLTSAKENLKNMAFFGLTEYQELSQILFENTFNIGFTAKFKTKHHSSTFTLSEDDRNKIFYMNRFDVMLYDYAKDIFFQRLKYLDATSSQPRLSSLLRKGT